MDKMRRTLLILAIAGALVRPASSYAEPPPSCGLVADPRGDANRAGMSGAATAMRSTDIAAADLAATAEYITAAVHLDDLYSWHSESPGGVGVALMFVVGDARFNFSSFDSEVHRSSMGGPGYSLWRQSSEALETDPWTFIGYGSGEWDEDSGVIYMTAALRRLKIPGRGSHVATELRAASAYAADALLTTTTVRADYATSRATYPLGARSCSRVPVAPCLDPEPQKIPAQDTCPGGA